MTLGVVTLWKKSCKRTQYALWIIYCSRTCFFVLFFLGIWVLSYDLVQGFHLFFLPSKFQEHFFLFFCFQFAI